MIKRWRLCTAQLDFGELLENGSNDILTINFLKCTFLGLIRPMKAQEYVLQLQ